MHARMDAFDWLGFIVSRRGRTHTHTGTRGARAYGLTGTETHKPHVDGLAWVRGFVSSVFFDCGWSLLCYGTAGWGGVDISHNC